MKVNRESNVLVCSGKVLDLNETLDTLVSKDSKKVANFLVEKASLPRELRTNALRLVLNEYVKIAKELVLSDEFMYRLNWYQKFSEFQLINFWNVLVSKNSDKFDEEAEAIKYKKTFYLLLLLNADVVGFTDRILEELLKLSTPESSDESFQEFMKESDCAFYDYEYNIDGMSYEDFKTNLKKSSTVADIRNIADKYDIKVPKRLKKEELVAIVCDGLRRQGKYDENTEAQLKKMSAITLQRFAKVNGINASTEMKKADVIDYIMSRIEASTKAVRKPRIELVSLPELKEFEFSKEYLREVNIVEEEDVDTPAIEEAPVVEEPAAEEVVEETPVVEEPVAEEVVEETPVVEEPAAEEVVEETPVEEAPVAEEVVEETPVVEEMLTLEETAVTEEIEDNAIETNYDLEEDNKKLETETPVDVEKLPSLEETLGASSQYNDELLATIIRLLEERDQRDVVNEVFEDSRFNNMINLYEERIKYLEKLIEEMRSTPVPITIQVTYPNQIESVVAETQVEEAVAEETVVEEPVVEETPVAEVDEETPVAEEPVTPVVLDATFENLSEKEKALVAKKEMKLADKVEVEHYDPKKLSKKNARKVKKLEKKQAKIDKIRSKNDLVVYRKNRRKKVKKTILTLFFLALFVFAALTTLGMLIDYGKITGQAAETIEKYLGYVKPFGQGGAVRTFAKDITLKIFHFFDDLLGLKK